MPQRLAACRSRLVAAISGHSFGHRSRSPPRSNNVFAKQQGSDLCIGRKLSDFIEEDRCLLQQLQAPSVASAPVKDPIVIVMVLIAVLTVVSQGSALTPFIYALF